MTRWQRIRRWWRKLLCSNFERSVLFTQAGRRLERDLTETEKGYLLERFYCAEGRTYWERVQHALEVVNQWT